MVNSGANWWCNRKPPPLPRPTQDEVDVRRRFHIKGDPREVGRGGCHANKYTHDYMRPVYTPNPYWINVGNNECGAGPGCIVACTVEGPKTIAEAELHPMHRVEAITCITLCEPLSITHTPQSIRREGLKGLQPQSNLKIFNAWMEEELERGEIS